MHSAYHAIGASMNAGVANEMPSPQMGIGTQGEGRQQGARGRHGLISLTSRH